MNFLQQFEAVLPAPYLAVAKLTAQRGNGRYIAQTTNGANTLELTGTGFAVGQTVFYDLKTHKIVETAGDWVVVDLAV